MTLLKMLATFNTSRFPANVELDARDRVMLLLGNLQEYTSLDWAAVEAAFGHLARKQALGLEKFNPAEALLMQLFAIHAEQSCCPGGYEEETGPRFAAILAGGTPAARAETKPCLTGRKT